MNQTLRRISTHLSQLPFCETFLCLWSRKKLREGVMPHWLTTIINWATSND